MRPTDIKRARVFMGFTQVELAQLIGCHPITVSKMERGVLVPSKYQVDLIRTMRETAEKLPKYELHLSVRLRLQGAVAVLGLLLPCPGKPPICNHCRADFSVEFVARFPLGTGLCDECFAKVQDAPGWVDLEARKDKSC